MPRETPQPVKSPFSSLMDRYLSSNRASSDNTTVQSPVIKAPDADQSIGRKRYLLAKEKLNEGNPQAVPIQNVARKLMPLPTNAGAYAMKKMFNTNAMDRNSLSQEERGVMYKTLLNAYKRTGNTAGGTEYSDYKGTMGELEYDQVNNAKKGDINPVLGTAVGIGSPGYNMATTIGRASYTMDPETHNMILSDTYDFKNNYTQDSSGKLKSDYMKGKTDAYSVERKRLAEQDQNINADRYRVKMELYPSDTLQTPSLAERFLRKMSR